MIHTLWTSTLLFIATTWAQNLTSSSGPTVLDGETMVHTVTVGLNGHTFDPASLIANPGDKVMFRFYAGNHSFIQSLYGWPCVPESAVGGAAGVNSGQQFANVQPGEYVTWNLTINDTNPIWYYCGAPGSCINYGMLGAINAANASEVEAQMDLAKQARYILYPGDTMPAAAAASISALASTVLPNHWANHNNNHSSPSATPAPPSHHLSNGAIAGIVIGAVVVLVIIGALIFFLGRNKGQIRALKESLKRDKQEPSHVEAQKQEMVVNGVTYVPAGSDMRASYLPPYHQDSRFDHQGKSPVSVLSPYSPPLELPNNFEPYPYPPTSEHPSQRHVSGLGLRHEPTYEIFTEPTSPRPDHDGNHV